MSWQRAKDKFNRLVAGRLDPDIAFELSETVAALDELQTADLTALLRRGLAHKQGREAPDEGHRDY